MILLDKVAAGTTAVSRVLSHEACLDRDAFWLLLTGFLASKGAFLLLYCFWAPRCRVERILVSLDGTIVC